MGLGAALATGLSPPLLAYGTAVYPELAAAAALAGAALLALRLDDIVSRRQAFLCFALLGTLPWLGTKFVPAGIVIGIYAARSLLRARRRTLTLGSVELALFSVALYVAINEALYDGPTPYAADVAGETATDAAFPLGYLERSYRLVALLIDRDYGLLRWAPVFALVAPGLWLLYRSRRELLSRALPDLRTMERAATMCAAALGAQLLVAAFLAPTMFGFWFPPRHLLAGLPLAVPLVAWGLRHVPRTGVALAVLTVGASVWLYLDVALGGGGLVTPRPDAPFGPLTRLLPFFGDSAWPYVLSVAIGCGLAALAAFEARHMRMNRRRHPRQVLRVAHERLPARTPACTKSAPRPGRCRAPQRQREHLRVVVVVADLRGLECRAGEGAVAGLTVGEHGAHQGGQQRRGGAVGQVAVPGHPLAPAQEARAEHVVGAAAGHGVEHAASSAASYSPSPSRYTAAA